MMKTKNISLIVFFALAFSQWVIAQGGFQNASEDCKNNYSIFYELYKTRNYVEAFEGWKYTFDNCKEMTKNIYIYGPTIVKAKIDSEKDQAKRRELTQLLYRIYDDRNKYFPEKEGYVIGLKAMDMMTYEPESEMEKVFNTFQKALELETSEHSAAFFNNYFIMVIRMYQKDSKKFGLDRVFETFNLISEALENNNNNYNRQIEEIQRKIDANQATDKDLKTKERLEKELENYTKVETNIELQIAKIATCDRLTVLYNDETFNANKNDINWLRRAAKLLQKERENEEGERESCITLPIFLKIANELNKLEPSATSSRSLGKIALYNKDYNLAIESFKKAAELEADPIKRADDWRRAGEAMLRKGQLEAAKAAALKSIQINSKSGEGYILLAQVYAAAEGVCGNNVFEKKAVYWAAIDKLRAAINADPNVANKARRLISEYSRRLPDKGISFQFNWKQGDKYTIGCWINETVTVDFDIK
ncbi:MAG: tetratricopeptide repeat protein [Thermaurantimonas sp.]|uniref:tetratricopeptide repeat protein n=1 Tax=Thermaurantimonas sp. TaxID=2681568 RepID=UPI00391CFB55